MNAARNLQLPASGRHYLLFAVAAQQLHQHRGLVRPLLRVIGTHHVFLQVLVQQLHQQAVGGTAHGGDLHQHARAVPRFPLGLVQRLLQRRHLTRDAAYPGQQLLSILVYMSHGAIIYPMGVSTPAPAPMQLDALAAARRHEHRFDDGNPLAERNTRRALWLTVAMMLVEIVGGWWFNSMAVLADGWHMSSHALALGLSVFAYRCARRYAHDPRFAFGTWKIEILAGYTSAIALLGVAALMAVQSLERLWVPAPIHYNEAIAIAAVGLGVNLLCAWWLHDSPGHAHHHHGHGHNHHHGHDHDHHDHSHAHGHDLNLRSAYVHVLADAATSVLAIVALLGGRLLGLTWLDPVMGLVGAVLVTVWAVGLLRDSGRILLDAQMDAPVVAEVREVIEQGPWPARLADLHVWQVGRGKYAVSASVVTSDARLDADTVRNALAIHEELVHVTVEIHRSA